MLSEIDKQQIDRLYALMEREKGDQDMAAALRWAIFQLEQMGREKQTGDLVFRLAFDRGEHRTRQDAQPEAEDAA